MYPAIIPTGSPSTVGNHVQYPQQPYLAGTPAPHSPPLPPVPPSTQLQPGTAVNAACNVLSLRVKLADGLQTTPSVTVPADLFDIPPSKQLPFMLDLEREITKGFVDTDGESIALAFSSQPDERASHQSWKADVKDPWHDTIDSVAQLGYTRVAAAMALTALGPDSVQHDSEKVVDFCKTYDAVSDLGVGARNVMAAIAVLGPESPEAIADACVAG